MNLSPSPAAPGLEALGRALRERRVSAVEVVRDCLARIAALEPRLQAFMHLDAERAMAHARAIDLLRASGVDLGPLMGVPVAVKDLYTVDGMPTTAGSRIDIQDLVPPQGSFVRALLRAGCVLLGKTRTTEFALGGFNFDQPPPWNPCDLQQPRMTGGSSHGSAVAMAAGLAGFTVGGDTGGSVRWPAALCGVVGYKASSTHWGGDGVFPLSPELDSVGFFTRSVHDAALVDAALADRPLRQPPAIDALTLAVPAQHFMENLDGPVAQCFDAALERLRRAGARIVDIEVPEASEIDEVFRSLVPADLLAFLGRARMEAQLDRLDPVAAERLQVAFGVRADDYVKMLARRRALERIVTERSRGIDAWVTPTVPMLPHPTANYPTVADVAAWNRLATQNTRPGNLFGQCGISLPIHHLGSALPVGLQLCASAGQDEALLDLARTVENVLGCPDPPVLDTLAP
ncbi:amidase [Methylibium sp.]|uniref:amidase n=1 Tax=Methylibium sp. TaxID=2067992 RepID=UPI0017BCA38E|nr:amidase [Methylibium sp.]MBA3589511.1 amidase [Methylibium sp.]